MVAVLRSPLGTCAIVVLAFLVKEANTYVLILLFSNVVVREIHGCMFEIVYGSISNSLQNMTILHLRWSHLKVTKLNAFNSLLLL